MCCHGTQKATQMRSVLQVVQLELHFLVEICVYPRRLCDQSSQVQVDKHQLRLIMSIMFWYQCSQIHFGKDDSGVEWILPVFPWYVDGDESSLDSAHESCSCMCMQRTPYMSGSLQWLIGQSKAQRSYARTSERGSLDDVSLQLSVSTSSCRWGGTEMEDTMRADRKRKAGCIGSAEFDSESVTAFSAAAPSHRLRTPRHAAPRLQCGSGSRGGPPKCRHAW